MIPTMYQMLCKLFFFFGFFLCSGLSSLSAAGPDGPVSIAPYELFSFMGIPITNSMLTSWVISIVFVVLVRIVTYKPRLIPSTGQAILEVILEQFQDTIAVVVGRSAAVRMLPLLSTFFLFILVNNLSGLFPGVGTFGLYDESGHLTYWMRPGNADLNMTLALSLIYFAVWIYYTLRYQGLSHFAHHVFGNKAKRGEVSNFVYYALFPLFFVVGILELFSFLVRPASLAFRLFGNVFGGETLLTTGLNMNFGWIVPVPFYLLEVLISLVQAGIFTMLVAVYLGLVFESDHEEEIKPSTASTGFEASA